MAVSWNIGLINIKSGKYLTAEKFGFKVVATGSSLKANQIWTLQLDGSTVSLRSAHGRLLSTTEKGVISADVEEVGDNEKFELVSLEGGQYAFKSTKHGYFFGGVDDQLSCFSKKAGPEYSWYIQIAMHPHICLKNEQRKTYMQLGGNELRLKAQVPWGRESAVLLEFDRETGKYAIRASNNKYLSYAGALVDKQGPTTMFVVEFHGESVAFRDSDGKYLCGVGPDATCKTRRNKVDKDERFVFEDSRPQVSLVSCANKKRVSCTVRGMEICASVALDEELSAGEIFQMEVQPSGKWAFQSQKLLYASASSSTLHANGEKVDDNCCYEIEWHDSYVTLKTASGRYVQTKPNGTLAPTGDGADDEKCQFTLSVVNRPIMVLRGCFGFVSPKGGATSRYECNRSTYEAFTVNVEDGVYYLSGANGKPWVMDSATSTFSATGTERCPFFITLRPNSKLLLKAKNGKYLRGESNGIFSATGTAEGKDTLWEF